MFDFDEEPCCNNGMIGEVLGVLRIPCFEGHDD